MMARGGKRSGAGRPKGSKSKESAIVKAERKKIEAVVEARRREIEAGVEIAKEQIGETARRYAAVALEALAVTAVYGEGMARVQAARELLPCRHRAADRLRAGQDRAKRCASASPRAFPRTR